MVSLAHPQLPVPRVKHPTPADADRDEYKAATCPLCFGSLQQRRSGLWCPRDRGWLVQELRGETLVYTLWQGRP